jgi:hypothetical protein
MTGLPGQVSPPRSLPDPNAVAALLRDWRDDIEKLVAADILISSRGVPEGWAGPAAEAALQAGNQHSHDLVETVLSGERAVRALDDWTEQLRRLHRERDAILTRIDAAGAELSRLAPLPDNTLATPALRSRAWQQHRDLCAAIASWQDDITQADAAVIAALDAPAPLDALASDHDPRHRDAVASARRALAEAAVAGTSAYLLEFDPDAFGGDGRVVMAFGDPATATHSAVVVPGITNDASTIDLQALAALSLEAAAAARSGRTCTIAWMGYDAPSHPAIHGGRLDPRRLPNLLRTVGEGAAEDGGHELVDFVAETREANPHTDVTVIGHSYGSTTVGHAARDGLDADRLVVLGSPGLGDEVDRASDLGLPAGAVFVGAADRDPVTWLGGPHRIAGHEVDTGGVGLGKDPSRTGFGAIRIAGDNGERFHPTSPGQVVLNHNSYFVPDSGFTGNVAAVVTGEAPATVPSRAASGDRLLAQWTVDEVMHETSRWWP